MAWYTGTTQLKLVIQQDTVISLKIVIERQGVISTYILCV